MRVLFVNENVGGHATVHRHLRAALDHFPDVEAVHLDIPAPRLARRAVGAALPGIGRLDADFQPLRAQLAASAWARRRVGRIAGTCDALHVYTHNAALAFPDLLRARPSVVSLDTTNTHNATRLPYRQPGPGTRPNLALTRPFERRVYEAATVLVANSAWAADSLRDDYAVEASKVRTFPFGIEAPGFGPGPAPGVRRDEGADSALPRLVFVGRQLERKGALDLLTLFRARFARRAELVIVSPEPVPPAANVRAVSDVTPGDRRLWDELRAGSIFVFPSAIDQAPNAVIEAMAAGLPVIACDVAALSELVLSGETGLLVPPGDPACLGAAIDSLLASVEIRARF
ncbi:MAG: glycosyltransferase family 4 protein, partial [Acidimicrobiia bacterium]|nr:glycosyltransferase family 4 protein [Acidimicrobiia bacterium]